MSDSTGDLAVLGHTVVHTDAAGTVHVQYRGPEHIVEGSMHVITLPPGATVTIRHLRGTDDGS